MLYAEPRTCVTRWALGGYAGDAMPTHHWSDRPPSKTVEDAVSQATAIARESGQDIGVFFMDNRFQCLVVKRSQWYDLKNRPSGLKAVVTWEGEVLQ